jgi:endonuclease/exonuclease/phosphatase family metal-dependent hydrolase
MKTGLCVLLLAALAGSSASADPLRVMSFNVRGAIYGFDRVDAWIWLNVLDPPNVLAGPHRRDRAIAVIDSYAPDLMGVQELRLLQRDSLLEAFPQFSYFGQDRSGGVDDESNGIFFRNDRLRLLEGGHFWLSNTPDVPGTTFAGFGGDLGNPRMATWAIFRDLDSRQTFFTLSTHWSLDSRARRESADLIQSYLPDIAGDLPILLLGDLNGEVGSTEYRRLRGLTSSTDVDLRDAYADAGGVDGRTFHAYGGGVSGSRIDHVLYAGDIFTPTSASILRNTYDGGLYPSDHYPVTVTFDVASVPEMSSGVTSGIACCLILGWYWLGRRRTAGIRVS